MASTAIFDIFYDKFHLKKVKNIIYTIRNDLKKQNLKAVGVFIFFKSKLRHKRRGYRMLDHSAHY